MTKVTGFSPFSMHKIEYLNIPFALRPVLHYDSMPLAKLPKSYTLDSDSKSESEYKNGHSVQKQHQVRRMWHMLL
jgi:hypothetical protein